MSTSFFITGGSGMIGSKILEGFRECKLKVDYSYFNNIPPLHDGFHLDISKNEQTIKLFKKLHPKIVIHSAALANVDLCETNHELADSINVVGTQNIVEACNEINSKIVYISTSFVFDGNKSEYFESDEINPTTYYGSTKQKSEEIIKNSGLDYLILRTDQPYCWTEEWQRMNSVIRMLKTLGSSKKLNEIVDWYNNPTYVPNFVEVAKKLIDENEKGIFHLAGSDFINRYEWALIVAEIFGLDKKLIEPINSKVLELPAKRKNIKLNNEKILKKTGIKMDGIKEGIKKMFDDKKNYPDFMKKL